MPQQHMHVANVVGGKAVEVIAAIVAIWQRLLPELAAPAGRDLLEHFANEVKYVQSS